MIITDANEFVGELHDRMPVILEPEQFEAWLTGTASLDLLKPRRKRRATMLARVAAREQLACAE
jgi:putative SOS response-associated peptidase YedK